MVARRTGDGLDIIEYLLRCLASVVSFTCYLREPDTRLGASDNLIPETSSIGANESTVIEKDAVEGKRDFF
jgi:hypothetical protein